MASLNLPSDDSEMEVQEDEEEEEVEVEKNQDMTLFNLLSDDSEMEEQDDQQNSIESDIEELQEDYDMPSDRAWGKKIKNFYSSDYKYTDYTSATQKDFANAEYEEQEAKKLHTRSAKEIFNIIDNRFIQTIEDNKNDHHKDDEQTIEFNKLNQEHKQALDQKESKAFTALITDFKECMTEVKEILVPFLKLVENGTCPDCDAVTFIRTKYHVILNYCINISFYLMLKAKKLPVQSHPVIKRLEQYRQLLSQLQSKQADLLKQMTGIVEAVKKGKLLYNILESPQKPTKKQNAALHSLNKKIYQRETVTRDERKQLLPDSIDMNSTDEEDCMDEEILDNKKKYNDKKDKKDNAILKTLSEEEEKRAITYQIAKNRGLTPYRKKELRNPRVKHRNKYRKAKIRRKGAVREVRKELTRYSGEISGIKAGVKKGIKLKV